MLLCVAKSSWERCLWVLCTECWKNLMICVPSLSLAHSPPAARWRNPSFVYMTVTSSRLVTCALCAGVVDLVCEGDISVKDGIDRLILFRQAGTSEQRMNAVSALQFLACNPDLGIANAAQRALHERFVDDSWLLLQNIARLWRRRGESTTKS